MPLALVEAIVDGLRPGLLTVEAQAVDLTDGGQLLWPRFMPRRDVPSVKVQTYTTERFRPVADQREWNQTGRLIPRPVGPIREIEMIPTESYFMYGEREMQELVELGLLAGNERLMLEQIQARVPDRIDSLVLANSRRIEFNVFRAWSQQTIYSISPESGRTATMTYGFDAGRYQTALTAWNDAGKNAYNELLAFLADAQSSIGPVQGALMRRATANAILADAPGSDATFKATMRNLEEALTDALGTQITIQVLENTVDIFDDAGVTTTSTKVWPAEVVAAVPDAPSVGSVAFAPVARAAQISAAEPDAQFSRNGFIINVGSAHEGKSLKVDCQNNALPMPNEQLMFVIDVGV